MIRVVLDTNVIVSAVLSPAGSEAYVVKLALAREVQVFVTPAVLAEYEEVLRRGKFKHLGPNVINILLTGIQSVAIWVIPTKTLAISPDENYNRFLECAEASEADYLVTGNKRNFPRQWKRTAVIGARELLEIITDAGLPA